MHDPPLGSWGDFDPAHFGKLFSDLRELLPPKVLVRHFAASKTESELHPLPIFEELLRLLRLPLQVVQIGPRPNAQLLHLGDVLLLLRASHFSL